MAKMMMNFVRDITAFCSAKAGKYVLLAVLCMVAASAGIMMYQHQLPDFTTADGKGHRWRDYQGDWLIVNYFAEWCAPCLREIPELNHWASTYLPEGVKILAMTFDITDFANSQRLVDTYKISFPLIVSASVENNPLPQPPYLPMTYIVNPEGKVVDQIAGEVSAELLSERLAQAQLQ